ncbi:hypothetical protein CR513_46462, partial [Mucuna pruriens]
MFQRVEVNILLLDVVKQVPTYAKFLIELCIQKRKKLKARAEVEGATIGTQPTLLGKCRDPRIFSIPCTIGDCTFADAILDLGASINVMLTLVYKSRAYRRCHTTGQPKSCQPVGILEDVLIQVNELIFPADFYVLDMEDETSGKRSTLILGRPFLMTARTKIDVYAETLSMEFGDNLVQFNIFIVMKHPPEDHSLYNIDMIDELVEEFTQLDFGSDNMSPFIEISNAFPCADSRRSITDVLSPQSLPDHELKPLSGHLKYVYLDNNQHSLVIIANNLYQEQEEKLLKVLWQHEMEIVWKYSNLPGINPSICTYRILMEEEARSIRQQQRRLNLTILDVVKKEVTKLLLVSSVQVVPKKFRMTVANNQHVEMVPTRIQNIWRVCIDYRKLNSATHKDHFRLMFIGQVLEKLARKSHFCFLDGYSRYMKIRIALEDQHKTTFTCPFGIFAYTRISFGHCNAPSTFQRCMLSIFSDMLE